MSTRCEICNKGPTDGAAILYRMNKLGDMPARWRCEKCMLLEELKAVDSEVRGVSQIIADSRRDPKR
jgi:hypothetical protein